MVEVSDVDFIRRSGVVFLLCFFSSWTFVGVSVIVAVCRVCVFMSICLFVFDCV